MTINELKELLDNYNSISDTERCWTKSKEVLTYENEYIKVERLDSSNKWLGEPHNSKMIKQWSIIFTTKKPFSANDKFVSFNKEFNSSITSVTKGDMKGKHGLRIYGMKKEPSARIIKQILDFIFN